MENQNQTVIEPQVQAEQQSPNKLKGVMIKKAGRLIITAKDLDEAVGGALVIDSDLAIAVERLAYGSSVQGTLIAKTLVTTPGHRTRLASIEFLTKSLPIVLTNRGQPEFKLTKVDVALVDVKELPVAIPKQSVQNKLQASEYYMLSNVCNNLSVKYNVQLQFMGNGLAMVTVPPFDGGPWKFKCTNNNLKFPVQLHSNNQGQLIKVVLGYYEIEAPDGFTEQGLESALTHCFNLFN